MSAPRALACVLAVAALGCGREAPVSEETRLREAFVRRLAEREGVLDVWSLVSRSDLVFDEGFAELELVDPATLDVAWHDAAPAPAAVRARPLRWFGPRALLRLRGQGPMRLELRGRVALRALYSRPRLTVAVDGRELWSGLVDADGGFTVAATVAATGRWSDVHVALSTVSEPWRGPAELRVAHLDGVVWEPAAAWP